MKSKQILLTEPEIYPFEGKFLSEDELFVLGVLRRLDRKAYEQDGNDDLWE